MKHVVFGALPLGIAIARLVGAVDEASVFSVMGNPDYDMPGTSAPAIDGTSGDAAANACADADPRLARFHQPESRRFGDNYAALDVTTGEVVPGAMV